MEDPFLTGERDGDLTDPFLTGDRVVDLPRASDSCLLAYICCSSLYGEAEVLCADILDAEGVRVLDALEPRGLAVVVDTRVGDRLGDVGVSTLLPLEVVELKRPLFVEVWILVGEVIVPLLNEEADLLLILSVQINRLF